MIPGQGVHTSCTCHLSCLLLGTSMSRGCCLTLHAGPVQCEKVKKVLTFPGILWMDSRLQDPLNSWEGSSWLWTETLSIMKMIVMLMTLEKNMKSLTAAKRQTTLILKSLIWGHLSSQEILKGTCVSWNWPCWKYQRSQWCEVLGTEESYICVDKRMAPHLNTA